MASRDKSSLCFYGGMLALILAILLGGTWLTIRAATQYLLFENAAEAAEEWAQYLTANVSDLEPIASGETPSSASLAFFRAVPRSTDVFRYIIFNRYGYSVLVSDRYNVSFVDLTQYDATAARSAAERAPIVSVKEGDGIRTPEYFAEAYMPAVVDGRPVAVVAAFVDQTREHASFLNAFKLAAAALSALTALSFTLPAIAWYRRTQEKQQADRRIHYLAQHDALTGLANRTSLIEALDNALSTISLKGGTLAVHFVDVDRFKEVNDTLGHDGGDFLLHTVAERLRTAVRIDDHVARLGGDEFIVVQRGPVSREDAEIFARRISLALSAPVRFGEHEITATVSIGVALAPVDGIDSGRLLKSADLALYQSKADGRHCVRFFTPEMDMALAARLALEKMVREAVQNSAFVLHFQPVFALPTQELIGFEALVRLQKPDGALIPPGQFIPVAEDIRLIDKIGAWVLREACRTATAWPERLTVAVNLSAAQFEAGDVHELIATILNETGLAPKRLELEIVETLLLANKPAILKQLQDIKSMGVCVVMDDFGTGHSSLSYLWRFPFDKIKIDRSFMAALGTSDRDAETVVKTIIALGRELKMHVTVEGVETAPQAAFLNQIDADQVQGFYFGRPMPATELATGLLGDFAHSDGPSIAAAPAGQPQPRTSAALAS